MSKKEFKFKIGADPEFNLVMQGRKIDAQQTLEFALKGKKNMKFIQGKMGFDINDFGNFGWDGQSSTAEIRPKAANTPQELIKNIEGILKEVSQHINLFDVSTTSEFDPIGGHIHFEVPKGESWSNEKRNALHRKMSSFYLPVLLSENKVNLNLRIRQGYGSLKDNRIQKMFSYPDGTDGFTYEFRCPSAEWMTTPKIALATLSYLAVVYHEIINKPRSFGKYSDIIYKSDKQGDALQTLAIMEFNLLTRQIMSKTKKYIKNFAMYEHYKDEIEYLFHPEKILKDKSMAEYNLKIGWKLGKNSQQPKKKDILISKNRFKQIIADKNLDDIKKVMNIHSNDDTNVILFTEALKDRISAFNWKLKNNYYIFGIRKGINEIVIKNFSGDFLAGNNLIKTTSDLDTMDNLFARMQDKFQANGSSSGKNIIIDFKTGKPKNINSTSILIGLPYEMRIKEDIKPFLESIWNIEKEHCIPSQIMQKGQNLIDDYPLPLAEKGEIYQILSNNPPTDPTRIVFARENASNRAAMDGITREAQQQEREEQAHNEIPENAAELPALNLNL